MGRAEVPRYFGELYDLDREVQQIVNNESRELCEEAQRLLSNIDAELVAFGQSRMLAQKLLRLQLDEVETLVKEGALSAQEAHLQHSIQSAMMGGHNLHELLKIHKSGGSVLH